MINYELSLWTHTDDFLSLLRGSIEFEGQAYDVKLKRNVNGEEELSFSLPLYVLNKTTGDFEENPRWDLIVNEKKIRLIRNRKETNEEIYDFVIKKFTESKDGTSKIMNVECKSYVVFELGKIGYSAFFDDETTVGHTPNIDFWMEKILPYTQNQYDVATNTSGWKFITSTLNEDITKPIEYTYDELNEVWEPVYAAEPEEKRRVITQDRGSNVFNILQKLAESFKAWVSFNYVYDSYYKVIGREISFYQASETEALYSLKYGTNVKTISRTLDSEDFITKMYVDPIESEFSDDGYILLDDAPQNLMMEPYIYNFEYAKEKGIISQAQYDTITPLQNSVRDFNILYREKVGEYTEISYNLNEKEVEQNFLTKLVDVTKENIQTLTNTLGTQKNTNISVVDYPVYVESRTGYKYARFYNDGISSVNITVKTLGGIIIDSSNYSLEYSTKVPGYVTGLISTSAFSENEVKVSYTYNPYLYVNQLKKLEEKKLISLQERMTHLKGEITDLGTDKDNKEAEINTILTNKKNALDTFEKSMFSAIKEGVWRNSDYQITKKYIALDEFVVGGEITPVSPYSSLNGGSGGSYVISGITSTILNNIDIDSIQVWMNNSAYHYTNFVDYTINFGSDGTNRNILFLPKNYGAFYYNRTPDLGNSTYPFNSTLTLKYLEVGGYTWQTLTLVKTGTHSTYIRKTYINSKDVFTDGMKIYLGDAETEETLLQKNIDYTTSLTDVGTAITFKDTTMAKHQATYWITYQTNNTLKFFYADAEEVLETSSVPDVSYDLSVVDLSPIEGYELYTPVLGEKVPIFDSELKLNGVYGFVSEISYELDSPENTSITINNYKTKFEDLFQRIVATSEQTASRSLSYARAASITAPNGTITQEIIQRSLDNNRISLSTGMSNKVEWGEDGITLTNATRVSSAGQVRIIGEGIFLSNSLDESGARVWKTGITANGINALQLTTGSIDTKKITIWDTSQPRFMWNAEGLFAYGLSGEDTDFNTYVRLNSEGLVFQRDSFKEVELDWTGLTIQGQDGSAKITSTYGFQVFDAQGTPQERVQMGRLYNGATPTDLYGIRIKNSTGSVVFDTDSNGNLTVAGTITANAGAIGGFTINSTNLTATNFILDTAGKRISLGTANTIFVADADEGIWLGNATFASAPFSVTKDGFLTATTAAIAGTINASAGVFTNTVTIGGATSGTLQIGTGTNKIKIVGTSSDTTSYINTGSTTSSSGNGFYLGADGKFRLASATNSLTFDATTLTVTGTINASAGTFSNSVYVGASSNRIVLDGTNKIIKSENYSKDVSGWAIDGTGFAEFESVLVRGAFKSSVFVYDEINAQGGTLMIAESAAVYSDFVKTNDLTLNGLRVRKSYSTQPYLFLVGDTIKIQTYINQTTKIILWLKIETQVSNVSPNYSEYNCSILAGSTTGNFTIPMGAAIVNHGVSGTGYILIRADDGNRGSYIKMIENITSDIHILGNQKVKLVLGDLTGESDSEMGSLTGYGLYAQNAYLTGTLSLPNAGMTNEGELDSSVRIWAGNNYANRGTAPFRVTQDGTLTLYGNGQNQMVFNPTTGAVTFGPDVVLSWGSISGAPKNYQVVITGSHIAYGDASSTLSATVYSDGTDITGTITAEQLEWFVNSVSKGTGKTKAILAADVSTNAQILCVYTP